MLVATPNPFSRPRKPRPACLPGIRVLALAIAFALTSPLKSSLYANEPGIHLTSPADGSEFLLPASVPLVASVVPAIPAPLEVRFFSGTNLLAVLDQSPFAFVWTQATPGTHALRAVASRSTAPALTSGVVRVSAFAPGTLLARADAFETAEDEALTVTAPGVVANDVNHSTEPATVRLVDPPQHGTLELLALGGFQYRPRANYFGSDAFHYRIVSATRTSETARVTLRVLPVPDPPRLLAVSPTGPEDTPLVLAFPWSDPDSDAPQFVRLSPPRHGEARVLSLEADRIQIQYVPFPDFHGDDDFELTASDGVFETAATASVTVLAVADSPSPRDDRYVAEWNTPLRIAGTDGVLANDRDGDGDVLTTRLEGDVAHGHVALDPDGGFVFEPEPGFLGVAEFTHRVSDGTTSVVSRVRVGVGDARWDLSLGGLPAGAIQVLKRGPDARIYAGLEPLDRTDHPGRASGLHVREGNTWRSLGAATWPGPGGTVRAIAWHRGHLVAAGAFVEAGGQPAHNVASWDGHRWQALGEGLGDRVHALAIHADDLVAAGDFEVAGGRRVGRVARWNGVEWLPLGGGFDARVSTLAVSGDGSLYAGGEFAFADGRPARRLARWTGDRWNEVGGGCDAPVHALLPVGLDVWIAGEFGRAGDVSSPRIVRWTGTGWLAAGNGLNAEAVTSLAHDGESILAGARGTPGAPANATLHRWSGQTWSTVASASAPTSATILAILPDPGGLLVAGHFETLEATRVPSLARLEAGRWGSLHAGIQEGSAVHALASTRDTFVAGGDFRVVAGQASYSVARNIAGRWEPLGQATPEGVDGRVLALATRGDAIYVGGEFTVTAGVGVRHLARWTPDGWSALGAGVDGPVRALALDADGALYVGGRFASAGQRPLRGLARWKDDAWSSVGEGLDGEVHAVVPHGRDLYVAGVFTRAGSQPALAVARWDGSSWVSLGGTPEVPRFDGPVFALAAHGRDLFAAGEFSHVDGRAADRLVRWDGSTWNPVDTTFAWPGHTVSIRALECVGGELVVGGDFAEVDGRPAAGIAVRTAAGWRGLGSGLGRPDGDLGVHAITRVDRNLVVGGTFRSAGVGSSDLLARWVLPHLPPSVSMESPAEGASFTADAPVTVEAVAQAGDAPPSRVEFHADGTLLGIARTAPYRVVWSRRLVGEHRLYARAIDTAGHWSETPPTRIVAVAPPGNRPPVVRLLRPVDDEVLAIGQPIPVLAEASDPDGSLLDLHCLVDGVPAGRFEGSPGHYAWTPRTLGSATLQAVARDDFGVATTSAPVVVRIQSAPEVRIESPRDGEVYSLPDPIVLAADARDPEGSIARLDFLLNGEHLASATEFSPPMALYRWEDPVPGDHLLIAVAVDQDGASTTSAPVRFRVLPANRLPTATMTAPADGTTVTLPTSVTLSAEASDPDGSVVEVRFVLDGRRYLDLGEPPFTAVLRNLTPGTHSLYVEVVDDRGGLARSATGILTATNDTARLPLYDLIDLGTLGGDTSIAYGIDESGTVVGQSMRADRRERGFVVRERRMNELPHPFGSLGGPSQARSIGPDGRIVGNADDASGTTRGFVLSGTNLVLLSAAGGSRSLAYRVDSRGRIAGAAEDDSGILRPAWFEGTQPRILVAGDRGGAAYGINAAGVVVGRTEGFDGRLRPFRYDATEGMHPLPGADDPAEPRDINDAGDVTGMFDGRRGFEACLWSLGQLVEMGTLGGTTSQGLAINRHGQVVGYAHDAEGQSRAFLWHGCQMLDLNTLLTSNPGWLLTSAEDINDRGEIVGEGLRTDGLGDRHRRAFLLRPSADSPVFPRDNEFLRWRDGTFVGCYPVPRGRPMVIERSHDLRNWTAIRTNFDRIGLVEFSDTPVPAEAARGHFYRFLPLSTR